MGAAGRPRTTRHRGGVERPHDAKQIPDGF